MQFSDSQLAFKKSNVELGSGKSNYSSEDSFAKVELAGRELSGLEENIVIVRVDGQNVDERAPAAAVAEERGKPARVLRWIDPGTRWTHLDVVVCIATGTTHLCLALPVEFDHRIPTPRWHQTEL